MVYSTCNLIKETRNENRTMIVIKTNNMKNITKAVAKNTTATKHGQVLSGDIKGL